MSDVNWNLVCGLLAFIVFMLMVRNIENTPPPRKKRKHRAVPSMYVDDEPHHTAARGSGRDEFEVSTGTERFKQGE